LDRIILDAASKQVVDPKRLKQPRYGRHDGTADESLPEPCCFDDIVGPLRDDLADIRHALRRSTPSEILLGMAQALQQLSQKIPNVAEKLEASDARLNHFEAIERELAQVLVHIARQQAVNRAPLAAMPASDFGALARDIAELRDSETKVQGSRELIHGAPGAPKPPAPADHALGSAAGSAKLSVLPDHGGRSSLIAAARRAAHSARGSVADRDRGLAASKISRAASASAIANPNAWLGAIAATLIVLGLFQIARILDRKSVV